MSSGYDSDQPFLLLLLLMIALGGGWRSGLVDER